MSKSNTEFTRGGTLPVIKPDSDGAVPSFDELKELLGDDDDAYLSDAQLEEDRSAAIQEGTRQRAKHVIKNRLATERKELDRQVAEMAATDPRDRKHNPYLTKQHNEMLARRKAEAEANVQALEAAKETLALQTSTLVKAAMDGQPLSQRAAVLVSEGVKPEVARLLTSLNMNLDLSLNGRQTEMLMTTLLTCNENQIKAIMANPKVPMAVKLMAKRLQDDLKAGSTTALEKLWDRIFGKGILDINGQAALYRRSLLASSKGQLPQSPSSPSQISIQIGGDMPVSNGRNVRGEDANRLLHDAALPNQPLSREAYLMIREHFAPSASPNTPSDYEPAVILPDTPADHPHFKPLDDPNLAHNTELEEML